MLKGLITLVWGSASSHTAINMLREPAWETGAGNLEDKVGGPRGNRRLPDGFSVN